MNMKTYFWKTTDQDAHEAGYKRPFYPIPVLDLFLDTGLRPCLIGLISSRFLAHRDTRAAPLLEMRLLPGQRADDGKPPIPVTLLDWQIITVLGVLRL